MLQNGRVEIDGISVLSELYLIPFKVKAHLDLLARKAAGGHARVEISRSIKMMLCG